MTEESKAALRQALVAHFQAAKELNVTSLHLQFYLRREKGTGKHSLHLMG